MKSRWRQSRRRKHLFTAITMPGFSRRDGVGDYISCRIFLGERSLPPIPSSVGSRYLSIRKAATLARMRNRPLFQGKMLRTITGKRLFSTVKSQNLKLLLATLVSAAHMFFLLCCCGHAHPARCGMQFLKFNKQVQRSNRSKRRRNAAAVTGCWYLYFSRPLTKQKKLMVFLFSSCPEWINRKRDLKFRRVVAEKKLVERFRLGPYELTCSYHGDVQRGVKERA